MKEEIGLILKRRPPEKIAAKFFDGNTWSETSYKTLTSDVRIVSSFVDKLCAESRQCVAFCVSPFLGLPSLILSSVISSRPFFFLDPSKIASENAQTAIRKLNVCWVLTNEELTAPYLSRQDSLQIGSYELIAYRISNVPDDVPNICNNFLYAITTSGTTGTPKVVRVPEASILPNIKDFSSKIGIVSDDVILLNSPLTFDPSMVEFFLAIFNSALLIMTGRNVVGRPSVLFEAIEKGKVSFYQTTPSLFNLWSDELKRKLFGLGSPLKTLVLGGERFPSADEVADWKMSQNVRVYNTYGITEVSCWATLNLVWPNNSWTNFTAHGVDIGEPLSGTLFRTELIESNQLHHLYIGSNQRICCLENEQFEELKSAAPVFRPTGDLFQIVDGKYYFLCRLDSILKRLGKKIDLSLVESTARNIGIDCRVLARKTVKNESNLIMFVIGNDTSLELMANLRSLKKSLPSDHWVDEMRFVDSFPLSSHGKLDKDKLLELHDSSRKGINKQDMLRQLWNLATTGIRTVNSNEGFISSGGSSFSAVLYINSLEEEGLIVHPDLMVKLLSDATYEECVTLAQLNVGARELPTPLDLEIVNVESAMNVGTSCPSESANTSITQALKGRIWPEPSPSFLNDKWKEENITFRLSWKIDLQKCVDASPLVVVSNHIREGSCMIVGSHAGLVVVAEVETGRSIARIQLPDRIEASASLSTDNKAFYIGCYDGRLYKISMENGGSILWNFTTNDIIKSTCAVHNRKVLFGSYDKHVYAVTEDGDLKWRRSVGPINIPVTPVGSRVIVGTLTGLVVCLNVDNGRLIWQIKIGPPLFSNVILVPHPASNNCLLVSPVNGHLEWRDVDTSNKSQGARNIVCIPVICRSSEILVASGSILHLLTPTGILWSRQFKNRIVSTPFVVSSDRVVVITVDGELSLVSSTSGDILSSYQFPGEVFSSPVVAGSKLFVGCRDNHLYCLEVS